MEKRPLKIGGRVVIPECGIARSFFTRFMGLMGRKGIGREEGLLFPKCNSIHTFFMRFPIDVVFLDRAGVVLEVVPAMKSWRMLFPRWKAAHVLELASHLAGELGISAGQKFEGLENLG